MDENTFKKRMYRSDMEIDYIPYKSAKRTSCLLTGVDFYDGIFSLYPIPTEVNEQPTTFRAHFSHCQFPIKMKIVHGSEGETNDS